MKHIIFETANEYPIAVLVKTSAFRKAEMQKYYVDPAHIQGIESHDIIAFDLEYQDNGKAPVSFIKEYLDHLLPVLSQQKTKYLYVTDAAYYKVLTKNTKKSEMYFGYVTPCVIEGYEDMMVVLGVNYQQLFYKPELQEKIDNGFKSIVDHFTGKYEHPGTDIIEFAEYPKDSDDIAKCLSGLLKEPILFADIEAFSLNAFEAGIGTIAFAKNKTEGVAFACDYASYNTFDSNVPNVDGTFGFKMRNMTVRKYLKDFFENYRGKLIWHRSSYDLKVLIYTLWMDNPLDMYGMLHGLEVMTRNFGDTKIIAYLALNSCSRQSYSLKSLAQEYAGSWAIAEIEEIAKIRLPKLLEYNLTDALCTAYIYEKYLPIMIQDKQENIYNTMMLPSQKVLLQTELCGMPMDDNKLSDLDRDLTGYVGSLLKELENSPVIQDVQLNLQQKQMEKANAKLKVKQHPLSHFANYKFNPNSVDHLQTLLYEYMEFPEIDFTDTGAPSTGGDTLKKLVNHTTNPYFLKVIETLLSYASVEKIVSSFLPAFKAGTLKADGTRWLHGSFNIGGTVSGRLSSSEPNLQNIPANSTYAKAIKEVFVAPKGWLFVGADFNSLEDYISALTTKDPNKLKVYIDGFDGHCLRAAFYFADQMVNIDITDPDSVNSIAKLYKELRQESKAPTFALTYQGTWKTLVNNLGWSKVKAKKVEAMYHELYKVSDEYIQKRLEQASKDGYVEVAFGLRVRTPVLSQVVYGAKRALPKEAAAEGRTAGNAMGQSYGLLNNRAINAFMEKVWNSSYKYDIKPVALIHDAIYLVIRDDLKVIKFVNDNLIKEMEWQDLPEIQHRTVKIGAALDIFYPNWAVNLTLPLYASNDELIDVCSKHYAKYAP